MYVIMCIILPVNFSVHHVQQKYTDNKRNNLQKMQFTT